MQSTNTSSEDNAYAVFVQAFEFFEAGVFHRLAGSDNTILRVEVIFAGFLAVEMVGRVVTLYFTGELRLE